MNLVEGGLQNSLVGDVVQAIQAGDAGVDGAEQVQLVHGLVQEDGRLAVQVKGLFLGLREHLDGQVGADHGVACLRQETGQGAGPAGQVQDDVHRYFTALEPLLIPGHPLGIVHVPGQAVVVACQFSVGAHASSVFFLRPAFLPFSAVGGTHSSPSTRAKTWW